jgi:hypothetical protein
MLQKQKYTFYLLLFWSLTLSSQTVLIDENFSSGTLPTGWSNIDNGSSPAGQIWEFNNTRGITAGSISGNYAILDSDNYGSGNNQNATLETPAFTTGIYETITLEYDYQYRDYQSPESCTVEVFNGTSWTAVANYTTNSGDNYSGATHVSLNITTQVGGASNAKVRFTYTGNFDWWWALDNVKISGTSPSSTDTYLGPGGVGNTDGASNLVLWTKPDDITEADDAAFGTWVDDSGYSSDLTQGTASLQPKIKKSIVNGYDVVRFEATNRRLRKNSFSDFPTANISGFYVNKTSDNNEGTFSYASSSHNNDFLLFRSSNARIYRGGSNITTGIDLNENVWNIFGFRWKSSGGTTTASLNGNSGYSGTLASGTSITAGGTLALAGEQDSVDGGYQSSQAHQGDFSEVILFNTYITEAQRIIVSNYLSAKYNIALSANDFYNEDDNGDFDHDVAGIGRASDGSLHIDSQGTGIIRIHTPSDIGNDEFLFWGRNNRIDYSFSTTTSYKERISSSWRVSKRNDLGTVTVEIDLTGVDLSGKASCASLQLIVDNDSNLESPTNTYTLVNYSGSKYRATGVTFIDNDYFTIQYIDKIVVDNTQFYNGSGTGNVPNTSDDCYKLLVKSTATGALTLTENADVREVEVESGGKLVVNTGTRLQIENGIALNGDIRLIGTSQLLQTHTGAKQVTGSGKLYKDQTGVTTTVYQSGYWTSPVTTNGSTFTINGVLKDGTVATTAIAGGGAAANINFINGHDGSKTTPITISKRWLAKLINATSFTTFLSPTAATLNPGEGWNMKSTGSGIQRFTFVGRPNDGDYNSSINQNTLSLIGNPYPSALDADKFIADNTSSITGTLYFYDSTNDNTHTKNSYTGGYATRVSGVGTPFSGGQTPGQYIPVGQAFFVTRVAVGTGIITFKNSQRDFQTIGGSSKFFSKSSKSQTDRIEKDPIQILEIGFEFEVVPGQKYKRQLAVAFRGKTSNYEAGYDAEMFDKQPSDFGLKVNDKTTPFVITGIENFSENRRIPLHVYLDVNREITVKVDALKHLTTNVYLYDAVTKNYMDLSEGKSVTLNIDSGTYSDRFFITFFNGVLSVDDENFLTENLNVYVDNDSRKLVIKQQKNLEIETVKLFSILGQEVLSWSPKKAKSNEYYIPLNKSFNAIYIVKLQTSKGVFSKKIIITK